MISRAEVEPVPTSWEAKALWRSGRCLKHFPRADFFGADKVLERMNPENTKTVLVVDDEAGMRQYLSEVLRREGYSCECFEGSLAALAYMASSAGPADLVLTDIGMPGMGGIDLLRTVKTVLPDLPVILISGLYDLPLAIEAVKAGAADYLLKPVRPNDVTHLVSYYLTAGGLNQREALTAALGRFLDAEGPVRSDARIREVFDILGFRRYETLQHSRRVAAYSVALGEALRLGAKDLEHLHLGALLHDIGKIAIPKNVLMKNGPLTDDEWAVIQLHPRIGWEMLSELPNMEAEAELVYCHHERFDGEGYPRSLKGDRIPLKARIFSIADTFDAIISDRPYRPSQPTEAARVEIEKHSGTQFDPELVTVFGQIPKSEIEEIQGKYPDEVEL